MPIGFYDTGLKRGFAARPDCAVHRPFPLGPRLPVILADLSHEPYVLTAVWLCSPCRSFLVDPPLPGIFSANSIEKECLRYVPSVARLLHARLCKAPCYGPSFFLRLPCVAITRLAYFSLHPAFFSATCVGLLHVSDPMFPT